MKIAFNPSNSSKNILDLIKNNKDIIFDLKGHSIYARGVEFKGTDTNTWRPVVDNLTSNSATSSLSANQGRVLAGLINGKSDSDHNHDGRYLKLTGGTLTGNLIGTSAMFSGRFYGNGDDEGIIIKPSSNGYAGLILGTHDGERSIFYFVKNKPFWRYSHGSDNLDIIHPKKSGTIALTSDIPSSVKNPYSLTTFGVVYDGSAEKVVSPSNFISQLEEGTSVVTDGTMLITSYASNSGFADTNAVNIPYKRKAVHLWEYIKAKTDSLYATKNHNHDGRYVRTFGTSNDNIDSDWGESFKTFDPIPSGTPPEQSANISLLSIGNNFNRRKQLAFIYNNDNIYYRRRVNNSFSNWRRLAFANEIPTSLKNPHALTISLNGTSQGPYDGSAAKNINITPGSIGAAVSNHSHDYLVVNTADDKSFNSAYHNFQVLYAGGSNGITGKPANVDAFGLFRFRAANGWSGQMLLANGGSLYIRSSEDAKMTNTLAWKTILDSSNYSGILDSRYYTESEVNSLLSKKLDRVNLSVGSWNPRGYNLAADYFYNGGDLSISESKGQIHVSIDGYFWQNEGQYRVLDTSDVAGLKGNLTVHQYLSNTDTTWWPLIWGGSSHANTSDSTGAVYKSHDKLSWQTSSQTLYATHLRTTYIDLENSRGIVKVASGGTSPYKGIKLPTLGADGIGMFSRFSNASDEGGIIISEDTSVIYNSFDTGWGLSVRDKDRGQTDISGDGTIAFGVRQDYRAYSLGGFEKSGSDNSYVLLGGGGHKLENALSVANADTVDGEHASAFTRIMGRHSIYTSGTAPYNYIHLFRIANSSGYSTVDCEIDFRTRYHSAKLEIRISTAQYPYNSGGSSISIVKKIISGRSCKFWFLPTIQTSKYNYYDVYYESGAWNSGSYGIIFKGSNGSVVFEHNGTNLASLPEKVTEVTSQWVSWNDIAGKPSSFTPSAHEHNYVLDIGNNVHTTFAYSKPGLSKDSITWLAVWNGYELRAMNKDQIALLGHTHTWTSITDKIVAGNEFNIVNAGFKEDLWFNYLPINDRSKSATISAYCFGNGNKGYTAVRASGFIKNGGNENQLLRADGGVAAFNWSGQAGQPTWLWGGNDFNSYYVYNPSNFRVAYASSAGNAETLGGFPKNYGQAPFNTIPCIGNDGVMEIGRYIDYHYDNSGKYDFSTRLQASGNNKNVVTLPSASGTLVLTSDILNYYWANVKISASSSTTTSPTVHTLTATRICAGHDPEIDNSISCSNWFRSSGNTGWYNTTYKGGIYMSDTSWIRTHHNVGIYAGQIYADSSIRMSSIRLERTNEINSSDDLFINYGSSTNVSLCNGGGNVGIGTISPTQKLDVNGNIITKGFGIQPYYLSKSVLLPTISPGDGYEYKCLEIGRTTEISCIIADKAGLMNERGILIKFNKGYDGQIILLKDLQNYGSGNGYFWVMPSGCNIIKADSSSILVGQNQISNTYNDGHSRFLVYSSLHNVWIEFLCANIN